MHRHKLHEKPPGWGSMGMTEIRYLMEMCFGMVEGAPGYENKIFKKKFHITADNHFSGDKVFEWIGEKGYGCTMTCRRDRLPAEIPSYNLHKKQTDSSKKCKVARFFSATCCSKKSGGM